MRYKIIACEDIYIYTYDVENSAEWEPHGFVEQNGFYVQDVPAKNEYDLYAYVAVPETSVWFNVEFEPELNNYLPNDSRYNPYALGAIFLHKVFD